MNKERLLKLADLLEADAANERGVKFDLGLWGATEDGSEVSTSCGTTACAMGLAVLSGAFAEEGLYNGANCKGEIIPRVGDDMGFGAAMVLFRIASDDADFLFCDSAYPDGKTSGAEGERFVAQRIRDFVNRAA